MRIERRIVGFLFVGGSVLLFGLAFLYLLVDVLHWNASVAYVVQAGVSLQANFLLNKHLNWRDRSGSFKSQWLKFHGSRVVTLVLEQVLYNILIVLGLHYILAKMVNSAVLVIVNFMINNHLIFNEVKA